MTREAIFQQIKRKQTYLCIGLDTDIRKIPEHLLTSSDPVFEFNRQIIEATSEYCIAYKPNVAFYESEGSRGWESLRKTEASIPHAFLSIADAKRNDIGNTAQLYARAFFEHMNFDAITVSPYMGKDAITPFLQEGKWAIILAHTSNPGACDFQTLKIQKSNRKLYEEIVAKTRQWGTPDQLMYVVGSTGLEALASLRKYVPNHFFLVPGIGCQGGDLQEVSRHAMTARCGLLINASRSILYASSGEDFAEKAREQARKIQDKMRQYLNMYI